MQELQPRDEKVITDAVKCGAVVILDVEDYIKEAEKQLNNQENYRKINYDLTTGNYPQNYIEISKRKPTKSN